MSQSAHQSVQNGLPAQRSEFKSIPKLHSHIRDLPAVSGLDSDYLLQDNCSRFRVSLTPFPTLDKSQLKPGVLIYHPTDPVTEAKEVLSEPYENEHGSLQVDTKTYYTMHTDSGPRYQTFTNSQFLQQILLEYTYVPAESVQVTFSDILTA